MNQEKARYRRYASFGPGGLNCPCCGPAPGKTRKLEMRRVKKKERRKNVKDLVLGE